MRENPDLDPPDPVGFEEVWRGDQVRFTHPSTLVASAGRVIARKPHAALIEAKQESAPRLLVLVTPDLITHVLRPYLDPMWIPVGETDCAEGSWSTAHAAADPEDRSTRIPNPLTGDPSFAGAAGQDHPTTSRR